MPTMPLSINGVSYTNTVAFLNEVEKVINRDVDAIINKINDYVSLVAEGADEYDDLPFAQGMTCRRSCCVKCELPRKYDKFVSKRKAVK